MMKKIFNKLSFEEAHLFIAAILMAVITFIMIVWPNISDSAITTYILLCWSFEPPIMHAVYDDYKDKKDIIAKSEKDSDKFRKKLLRKMKFKKNVTNIITCILLTFIILFVLLALCTACMVLFKLFLIAFGLVF